MRLPTGSRFRGLALKGLHVFEKRFDVASNVFQKDFRVELGNLMGQTTTPLVED